MIRFFLAIFDFVVGSTLLGAYGAWVFDAWQAKPAAEKGISNILQLACLFPFQEKTAAYLLLFGALAIVFGVLAMRSGPLFIRKGGAAK